MNRLKIIAIVQILVGALAFFFGSWDIGGDIGVPLWISATIAISSGIGFWSLSSK
jgi:hypothetical protein